MSTNTFDIARSLIDKANTRWWEKREVEELSEWQELKDPTSGANYYYNSVTKEVTWEKPSELMSPEELDHGASWVWVDDSQEVFIPARIISQSPREIRISDQNGKERTITYKKGEKPHFPPLKRSSLQRIVNDLVLLDSMEAPLILHNLRERFQKNEIYTNIGTILIAINPYCSLPLYTDDIIRSYARRKLGEETNPHTFNIAHDSFIGLRDFNKCQSIIISGESGSGKTVSTKHCLNYLAFMAGAGNISERILETNPILEAFGNAKTSRNDNSSRFGKYMQLYFRGKNCTISGCIIRTYLLEKIRVVHQNQQERNFHIFYQLLSGASPILKKKLMIENISPQHFRYLKMCTSVDTIDDDKDFQEVLKAFAALGFDDEKQYQIFSIVTAIIKMGNIKFLQDSDHYAYVDTKDKESALYLQQISQLLHLDEASLSNVFVTKELRIRNQQTTVMKLRKEQSMASRDAFAKFIYGYLFDWIVTRLNIAIGQPNDQSKFIGCLDIFGFEIFDTNSFEQLCINFTNEMLQQHFNYQTFKLEQQVYEQEKISYQHVEFIDNQPMLDLISHKPQRRIGAVSASDNKSLPMGILPTLDEELVVVKGSDQGFLGKICEAHQKSSVFQKHPRNKLEFIIKHYAGNVVYDVSGFLEKNRDVLTEDCIELLRTSTHPLLMEILPQEVSQQEKRASLGSQFCQQLTDLMTTLRLTEPHYIRCIKPNSSKTPIEFTPRMCHEQLTYSGVYEATKIRKLGYPFRLQNQKFVERYAVLFDDEKAPGNTIKDKCKAIIKFMKLNTDNIQIGVSMVLYRAEEHKTLELHRNIKVRLRECHEDLARLVKTDPSQFVSDENKEQFFMELASTVRNADEFRIHTLISEQAREMLDKYVEDRIDSKTKQQLQLALQTKDKTLLEKVLRICQSQGYQTSLARQCGELLESIGDCEQALIVSINERSIDYLQRALQMYNAIGYIIAGVLPPLVQEAQSLLEKISLAHKKLDNALRLLDYNKLRNALDFCEGFKYNDAKVATAKAKYKQITEIRALLTNGFNNFNLGELSEGLDLAHDMGYEAPLVSSCELLLWRCTRIEQEAVKALNTLNDPHVRIILKAANEISYPIKQHKQLKKLRQLVDGPSSDYFKAQLECSQKVGDHERAITLNQMLALERLNAASANTYQVSAFRGLKIPQEWGEEKFWGSSTYRAQTMLTYNDAYVHSPITTTFINMPEPRKSELTEKVLLCYENVQKIMLCRSSKRLAQRTEEVLAIGSDYLDIRDEIYIAIIKMITNNQCETPGSVQKGFELLTLCLLSFPPSHDFSMHLYWFLSQPIHQIYVERWNMTFLLARIIYLNATYQPFWAGQNILNDMPTFLQHIVPKQVWVYETKNSSSQGITTYDDLKIKWNDPDFDLKSRKAYNRSKKAEKRGLCVNVIPSSVKRKYQEELDKRKNAHTSRSQGIIVLPPTQLMATIDQTISQQWAQPVSISLSQQTNFDDDDDDDGDDGENSDNDNEKEITNKKKKGKKTKKNNKPDLDDDEDNNTHVPQSKKKNISNKKQKKQAVITQPDSENEFIPEQPANNKALKKNKKVPAVIQQDDNDDSENDKEMIVEKPKKAKKAQPSKKRQNVIVQQDSDEEEEPNIFAAPSIPKATKKESQKSNKIVKKKTGLLFDSDNSEDSHGDLF